MSGLALRRWRWLHRWSSIACTVFLLILCMTGLPLIFEREIVGALDDAPQAPAAVRVAADRLDALVARAQARRGGERIRTLFVEPQTAQVVIRSSPGADTPNDAVHEMTFDAGSGALLHDGPPPGDAAMSVLTRLHISLFAGLPGEIFLALIGMIFILALVSGVVLYAPFARRLDFGEIRRRGSRRLAWLDAHNMIGVVTLAWAAVIGVTGAMNGLATPLFGIWQIRDVAPVLAPYVRQAPVVPTVPVSAAIAAAERTAPGLSVGSVTYPSHVYGSPLHYVVWLRGATKLRARLFTPVLVDARDGHVTYVAHMPWYLRILELSRPLHFGDYGGMPMKLLWAVLDGLTIVVLGSGLYLLLSHPRRGTAPARPEEMRLLEGGA